MNVAASGRTWEDASAPAALRLTRRYEQAWKDAGKGEMRPHPRAFLDRSAEFRDMPGACLALLRMDMTLRWEDGERVAAGWYVEQFPELSDEAVVALAYEEFCLLEEEGLAPDADTFLMRYAPYAEGLRRVLEIHRLVGSATATSAIRLSSTPVGESAGCDDDVFPEAGQTIAGFHLVEELGRGAFARVFLARERQLADRPVALKVTRRASREPQTLARLQHTHIVPVHSHRVDPATGLHLLCMPYFGRVTLAQLMAAVNEQDDISGTSLVTALDGLEPSDCPPSGRSTGRAALSGMTFPRAVAWWGARLAEALGHAHDRGILHRDIKPSNVLVTGCGMPMLLDFNLAHESVLEEGGDTGATTLGGTVDYMAPEHLEALADGLSEGVDGRSDLYGLGVVLFEVVMGRKPFSTARRGSSLIGALLRAADERRQDPTRLFARPCELPASLQAVIAKCLQPDPNVRYQSADQLSVDLQAVADDQPLVHAREPLSSRSLGLLRRNQRKLAMVGVLLLAGAAISFAAVNKLLESWDGFDQGYALYKKAVASYEKAEYKACQDQFDAVVQLAARSEDDSLTSLFRWDIFREFGGKLRRRFKTRPEGNTLQELAQQSRQKSMAAERFHVTRKQAADLLNEADTLRFRLIGLGEDQPRAVIRLKELLIPFYVLTAKGDWTKLDIIWELLEPEQKKKLPRVVNELLFLWMAGIDNTFRGPDRSQEATAIVNDLENISLAMAICDQALKFVEPKGPWLALRAQLEEHGQPAGRALPEIRKAALSSPTDRLAGEPAMPTSEDSAVACFQWGLLCSGLGHRGRAIEWLERAVLLDWSNYWYQFYLGYLDDEAGFKDDALGHYNVALALNTEAPWVRFSRARLNRSRGLWSWAIDDLRRALRLMQQRPESLQVLLELGYVYQVLGNYPEARIHYEAVIHEDAEQDLGRAARLNLANMDAESGQVARARVEYDALLTSKPQDHAVRLSRALLLLRVGRGLDAEADLNMVLGSIEVVKNRDEVLAARAISRLLLHRVDDAVKDASEAFRLNPTPAHNRLRQRALLAAGRHDELQIDRPDEVALFPVASPALAEDLRVAINALTTVTKGSGPEVFRAALIRAVLISATGDHRGAREAARLAIRIAPYSPRVRLISARLFHQAGEPHRALEEIERGLKLQPDEPGLLELRGVIRTEVGQPGKAIGDFDLAIAQSGHHAAHLSKAAALVALGDHEGAILEWSTGLKRDPEVAGAFVGRARSYVKLRLWELALADLEQAASWAHSDLRLEFGIVTTYFQCLKERPNRWPRWVDLVLRTGRHLRDQWLAPSQPAW